MADAILNRIWEKYYGEKGIYKDKCRKAESEGKNENRHGCGVYIHKCRRRDGSSL
jgi:hypothetical protein